LAHGIILREQAMCRDRYKKCFLVLKLHIWFSWFTGALSKYLRDDHFCFSVGPTPPPAPHPPAFSVFPVFWGRSGFLMIPAFRLFSFPVVLALLFVSC
jgi:hypothetical protein